MNTYDDSNDAKNSVDSNTLEKHTMATKAKENAVEELKDDSADTTGTETTTDAAAGESAAAVNTEQQQIQAVISDENAGIADFEALGNQKLVSPGYVALVRDISDAIINPLIPENDEAEIERLLQAIKTTKDTLKRLKYTVQMEHLLEGSQKQFDKIREATNDLSDDEFLKAHYDRIQRYVDARIIDFLKKNMNYAVTNKRAPKGTKAAKAGSSKTVGPKVSFMLNDKEYVMNVDGGGKFSADVKVVAEKHGLKKKADFIAAIKSKKVPEIKNVQFI